MRRPCSTCAPSASLKMSWTKQKRRRLSRSTRSSTCKAVAASEGSLVVDFSAGEDQVVALFVEAGKAEAEALQVLVAGVFEVVLVDRVVDNALEIAFVVADG